MVIVTRGSEAAQLRRHWGQNLQLHLDEAIPEPITRKELQRRLAEIGYEVSLQAISLWLRGEAAPRAAMQAAIAKVLGVPARSLFPLPTVPEVA